MAQDALVAQAEIARLKFQLARYRRAEFGRSSEKLAREAEQLELALEALETDQAERLVTASPAVAAAVSESLARMEQSLGDMMGCQSVRTSFVGSALISEDCHRV